MIHSDHWQDDEGFNNWSRRQRRGRIAAGILVILAGLVYLLYQLEYAVPAWLLKWPTLIVAISLITMIKHGWRDWRWVILAAIGLLFMGSYAYPDAPVFAYKIPILLFIIGGGLILKPRNKKHLYASYHMKHSRRFNPAASDACVDKSDEDYVFINNVFAGTEKMIFSKDFKGGDIRNTFGGCELNLMQAEIKEEAVLIVNQQFGGTKLIIPPHWVVKSDITCVFAGIEDKRPMIDSSRQDQTKALILRGNMFMSGLDIVSY